MLTLSELSNVKVGQQYQENIIVRMIIDYLFVCAEVRCVAEPRDDDKLLCADGDTGSKWTGCVDRGSVRIQCPKNFYPCNNMNSNNEFICSSDCSKHGDKRTTCYADSDGDD